MPLDPEFVADAPYGPEGLFIDEVLTIDPVENRVVCRMPTYAELPLTNAQRCHPVKHPRHVNGGLMVHMTGILGFVHAYYVLGLRHADGWIGYGARARDMRFKSLATIGEPVQLSCRATQVRRGAKRVVARYHFLFTQEERVVYESDQTGMFMRIEDNAPDAS